MDPLILVCFILSVRKSVDQQNNTKFAFFFKLKPRGWIFVQKYKKILKNLRDIGREQIQNRIKAVAEGQYIQNDLLANIFKSHGNFVLLILFNFRIYTSYLKYIN